MTVRRRAVFHIDAHEMVGERLRVSGHLSRTGIQVYDDGFGGKRREYRPPTEVFDAASLASLRAIPVTIRHPRGMVTPKSWRRVAVGHVGDDVCKADDNKHTTGPIWLHDERAIDGVISGELTELSVGYTAELEDAQGVTPEGEHYDAIQRSIRGNHLALLGAGEARGGATVRLLTDSGERVCRLDAEGHEFIDDADTAPDEDLGHGRNPQLRFDGFIQESFMTKKIKVGRLDFDVECPENFIAALEAERADAVRALADAEKRAAELAAKVDADAAQAESAIDALAKEVVDLKAQLGEATDPKRLAELAEARAKLIAAAKSIGLEDVKPESSDMDVKRDALVAAKINLEGKSDAYVEARFDAEVERLAQQPEKTRTDTRDARRAAVNVPVDDAKPVGDFSPFRIGGL